MEFMIGALVGATIFFIGISVGATLTKNNRKEQ